MTCGFLLYSLVLSNKPALDIFCPLPNTVHVNFIESMLTHCGTLHAEFSTFHRYFRAKIFLLPLPKWNSSIMFHLLDQMSYSLETFLCFPYYLATFFMKSFWFHFFFLPLSSCRVVSPC